MNGKSATILLVLGFAWAMAAKAQTPPAIAVRITDAVKAKEPTWQWVSAIQSGRVPVVPSEKTILVGSWNADGQRSIAHIAVYEVGNLEDAKMWLRGVREGRVYPGWHVAPYAIGDEGFVSTYEPNGQAEIQFRSANFVVSIGGADLASVQRVAAYVLPEIAPR